MLGPPTLAACGFHLRYLCYRYDYAGEECEFRSSQNGILVEGLLLASHFLALISHGVDFCTDWGRSYAHSIASRYFAATSVFASLSVRYIVSPRSSYLLQVDRCSEFGALNSDFFSYKEVICHTTSVENFVLLVTFCLNMWLRLLCISSEYNTTISVIAV